MISQQELEQLYLRHRKTVWNICYGYFLHPADTEDAVHDTFVRLAASGKRFRGEEHEKAWLIATARNICRDELKKARRRNVPLEQAAPLAAEPDPGDELFPALHALPEQYRTALYLYYYEALPTKQIARLVRRPESTVRSHLRRGRMLLRKYLEENEHEQV